MDPRFSKLSDRIREVIVETDQVLSTVRDNDFGSWIEDKTKLNSWLIKCRNIICITFGENSTHYKELNKLLQGSYSPEDVQAIKGLLIGALDDFNNGFITGQEFLIAGEIFDTVLEESKHLVNKHHKDAAAVLGRVVIEDCLKRIARREGIDDTFKASRINDELKKANLYSQPQWRLIQSWLDTGNAAAHGNFSEYDENDVTNMLSGIEHFFANHF